MKVLIAEDDRISRSMLQRQLEKWGHAVVAAVDGKDAWEKFQAGGFSIVVSDWMMPEMDGIELVRRIRESQTQGYVFVILLTARSKKEDVIVGMEAGADDFLSKPFDQGELRVRLRAGERIIELERSLAQRNALLEEANQRMTRDLEAAARVQQSLLPAAMPDSGLARFAWHYRPCDELAGDFLNVFALGNGHVGMYVADVSGHGVAASLLSVSISRVMTPHASASSLLMKPDLRTGYRVVPPREVLAELNRRFQMEQCGDRYFTIIYGVLDLESSQFRYASAGHPPLVLLRPGQLPRTLEVSSLAVGWVPEVEYEEHVVQLSSGDRVLLYTDGIPEAMGPERQQLGEERMLAAVEVSRWQPLQDSVASLARTVEDWCGTDGPEDDVSLLVMEIP
ncbi:MAG: PP2C family protein-serine/threonine phosphatase [Thermoguttaceae bacterium]